MQLIPKNAAQRRYTQRFLPTMVLYVIALFAITWVFAHHHPTGIVVYVLAILPALPLIGTLAVVGLYLAEEPDEFERSILIQSMLWGIGATLALSTVWGFLENFTGVHHLPTFYVFVLFWVVVGISQPFIRMRYR
jgi:hypothetical protein